jgi:hypothetical protein
MELEEKLKGILAMHPTLVKDLTMVRSLNLPDWCIAAGYVRNFVWDYLHGKAERTPLNDIDILYYDVSDELEDTEKRYEEQLRKQNQAYDWSVKNQARMHVRNHDDRYESSEAAMMRWPETVTAVGVTLDDHDEIRIVAPFGLNDLFDLIVRKSPYFKDSEYYLNRVNAKGWKEIWPRLKIIDDRSR